MRHLVIDLFYECALVSAKVSWEIDRLVTCLEICSIDNQDKYYRPKIWQSPKILSPPILYVLYLSWIKP